MVPSKSEFASMVSQFTDSTQLLWLILGHTIKPRSWGFLVTFWCHLEAHEYAWIHRIQCCIVDGRYIEQFILNFTVASSL